MVRTEYRSAQSGRTFTVVVLCDQSTRSSDIPDQKAALRQQRAPVFGRGWLDDEVAVGNALVRRLDAGHVLAALDAEAVARHRPCTVESLFKTLKKLHHARDIRDRDLRAVPYLLGTAYAILRQEGLVRVMTTREVKAIRAAQRAGRTGGATSAPESSLGGDQEDQTPNIFDEDIRPESARASRGVSDGGDYMPPAWDSSPFSD
eukprot:m51a1_g5000 hypothetical protein (204) ;mRNA; f:221457-222196